MKQSHGKVCKNVTAEFTTHQATKEPTITLSFHTGALRVEEVISVECASLLIETLSKLLKK